MPKGMMCIWADIQFVTSGFQRLSCAPYPDNLFIWLNFIRKNPEQEFLEFRKHWNRPNFTVLCSLLPAINTNIWVVSGKMDVFPQKTDSFVESRPRIS